MKLDVYLLMNMKTNEIDKLINETLYETVKEKILTEQKQSIPPILGKPCFENKIKDWKQQDNKIVIDIRGVNEEEAFNCFDVDNVHDLQRKINIGIQDTLEEIGMEDSDVDINVDEDKDGIGFSIKIIKGEILGENMKKTKQISNFFEALTEAKKNNKKTFIFENEKLNVNECWDQIKSELTENVNEGSEEEVDEGCGKKHTSEEEKQECEECGDNLKENKKVVQLTETEFLNLIKKVIKEASAVRGISVTKDVTNKSKRSNDEYINSVDKKMKNYLKFDGNDNPEFPGQIGTGDVKAHRVDDEGKEYIENFRGGKPTDLDYDTEPSEQFIDRVKKALTGDSTMGNEGDPKNNANVTKSKTGEEMMKTSKRKKEVEKKQPMYVKDKQPVVDKKNYLKEQEDYRDERGNVPGEQDTGPHEYTSDINSSGDFMDYGHNLLQNAHGENYDENQAHEFLTGIIQDKRDGKINSWGEAVGILQQSLEENENYDEEQGVVPGEQDTGPDEYGGAINEDHLKTKASRIAFILKNDKNVTKKELEKMSDKEIENKYKKTEKKMGLKESKVEKTKKDILNEAEKEKKVALKEQEKQNRKVINEEIQRMKQIYNYNGKTQ